MFIHDFWALTFLILTNILSTVYKMLGVIFPVVLYIEKTNVSFQRLFFFK